MYPLFFDERGPVFLHYVVHSQQSRDGLASLINNRLGELGVNAACILLIKLTEECAKDKWGRLPPPVKSAVVKVRA